ncbi:MAG: 7-cyano-7-deazaguanine synthase [Phycisphaerales bacterium]
MDTSRTLLVHFGDLPSLAAACGMPDPANVVPWHPVDHRQPGAAGRRRAAERSAEAFGMLPVLTDGSALPSGPGPMGGAVTELALLARAVATAAASGCGAVHVPTQRGQVARDVLETVERIETFLDALVVGGGAVDAPRIELPVVDLDDDQIVDLVAAAGRSFEGAWPCDEDRPAPCGRCRGCRRWGRAMERAGVRSPWSRLVEAGAGSERGVAADDSAAAVAAGAGHAGGPGVIVEPRADAQPTRPGRSIAGFVRSGAPRGEHSAPHGSGPSGSGPRDAGQRESNPRGSS